jgi:hypothetical protein
MNKSIIIVIALVASAIASSAQNKPVSAHPTAALPKPTYILDVNRSYDLSGKITLQQVNDFLVVLQVGLPALESHPSLTGAQISVIKTNYKTVADTLLSRYNRYLEADKARFTADTTKQFHPKK